MKLSKPTCKYRESEKRACLQQREVRGDNNRFKNNMKVLSRSHSLLGQL